MILATTQVKDLDHFLEVFGAAGADKRGSHGSKGATRLPRPDRGEPRLGGLRLGRGGLDGVRHRPRDPRHHAGGRPPGPSFPGEFLGTFPG